MGIFDFGSVSLIQQELRRFFASRAQGELADTAIQPIDVGQVVQAQSARLSGLAALTGAGGIEKTGIDTFATYALTAFGKSLVGSADPAAGRTALALTIGSNVQAWNTDLDGLAGLSTLGLLRRTGAGAYSTLTVGPAANNIPQLDGSANLLANGGFSGPSFLLTTAGQSARFICEKSGAQSVPNATGQIITGWSGSVIGSGFNPSTGEFTAPANGIYTFEAFATITAPGIGAGIQIYRLLLITPVGQYILFEYHNASIEASTSAGGGTTTIPLTAGQIVVLASFVQTHNGSAGNILGTSDGIIRTHFRGYKTLHAN